MKRIEGPSNPNLVKEYNVTQYPTLILVKQGKPIEYKGKKRFTLVNKVSSLRAQMTDFLVHIVFYGLEIASSTPRRRIC